MIEENYLFDVWRGFNENTKQYTWAHARDNVLTLATLDTFYCFKHPFRTFKNCFLDPVGFSHHNLVACTVTLDSVKPKSFC